MSTDLEEGRELLAFGTQCDSLIADYLVFPDKMDDKWARVGVGLWDSVRSSEEGLAVLSKWI